MTPVTPAPAAGGLAGAAMLPPKTPAPKPARPPTKAAGPGGRPAAGRFAVLNDFTDYSMAELTPAEVRVWLVLYRDTKPDGLVRTGQTDIARRAGLKSRSVKYAVAGLTLKGLIEVVRRGRLGKGPSVYRVRGVGPAAGC